MVMRFIPAGAGNTQAEYWTPRGETVHPRWRGEHALLRRSTGRTLGSSPLARGTHFDLLIREPYHRFIPAGAGNTNWLTVSD